MSSDFELERKNSHTAHTRKGFRDIPGSRRGLVTGGTHPNPPPNLSSVCSVHPYKLARTSFLFWGVFSSIVLSVCHQLSFGYKDKHNMLKDKQVEIQSGPLLVLQKSLELLSRNTKWVKQNLHLVPMQNYFSSSLILAFFF